MIKRPPDERPPDDLQSGGLTRDMNLCKKAKKYCRHKWSEWQYGGSFRDGYERVCLKCLKAQAK